MEGEPMSIEAPVAKPNPNPLYEKLKAVRASTKVELHPTPMLKQEITGFDGTPQPFKLRYYQAQGIFHLLAVPRMVLGDGTGLGKTVQVLGFLAYSWAKDTEPKAIVVCPKSAIRQWEGEIKRFMNNVQVFVASGTLAERKAAYAGWEAASSDPTKPRAILITNYHSVVRDWDYGTTKDLGPDGKVKIVPGLLDAMTARTKKLIVVYDECTAFKNPSTKTSQTCGFLSQRSARCIGLTATLLKNNLMEGFGIYKVIRPDVFTSKYKFMEMFCVTEMQRVKSGGKVPIVVGYKNLATFRSMIDPYFYGRSKHEVSNELPALTTREVICELSPAEDRKYAEALSGVIELGDGELKDYQETKVLTSLIYCQQVVNSLSLIKYEGGDMISTSFDDVEVKDLGAKEQALVDLLTDEFDDEKVIVYTRFEGLVGRLQKVLEKHGIKSARITGKEDAKKRSAAQAAFQNLQSKTRVIFITDAGSEAINLQAASGTIFYDTPWSWGTYVQLLGRMIRIGSPHQNVLAVHIIARRPAKEKKKQETIDDVTVRTLRKKKSLIDRVIGEAAQGALTFERGEGSIRDLYNEMRESA
jgi:SNF2 family DNA or RNA helicase